MKVAIVGHGVSLTGAKKGKEIDSFDRVVRLKGSNTVLGTDDFGYKVDALVASTEIMGTFFKMDAPEYWAYPKKGVFDEKGFAINMGHLERPVVLPWHTCNHWNNFFRQMKKKTTNHHNVSTGTAAIIIACNRWNPDEIKLFGFDTVMNPEIPFNRHSGVPRSGVGAYPDHDWQRENDLIRVLENTYRCRIYSDPYKFPPE